MARRIEITVPSDFADLLRTFLEDPEKLDFGENSSKPGLYVELPGVRHHIFILTLPGPRVSNVLDHLKSIGVGTVTGQVTIQTLDCKKPGFNKASPPKTNTEEKKENVDENKESIKKAESKKPMGFSEFAKARLTTEEIYNSILNGATMTPNTWINLVGACLISGGGLTTNQVIFIVAAMLVSPIMGPILGMVFGYRIADWKLFKLGFINCVKMTIVAFICGIFIGLVLGSSHNTYMWPTSVMIVKKNQLFSLIVSIVVSGSAGMVLGVSVTSGGVNSLVGTALSAGLLPPIVNAGMLITYAFAYAAKEARDDLYEMAQYALGFYVTHVVIIFVVANTLFWLKEINSKFRDKEDDGFDELPTLKQYKARMEAEKEKGNKQNVIMGQAAFLMENLKNEFDDLKTDVDKFMEKIPLPQMPLSTNVGGRQRAGSHMLSRTGRSASFFSGEKANAPTPEGAVVNKVETVYEEKSDVPVINPVHETNGHV